MGLKLETGRRGGYKADHYYITHVHLEVAKRGKMKAHGSLALYKSRAARMADEESLDSETVIVNIRGNDTANEIIAALEAEAKKAGGVLDGATDDG